MKLKENHLDSSRYKYFLFFVCRFLLSKEFLKSLSIIQKDQTGQCSEGKKEKTWGIRESNKGREISQSFNKIQKGGGRREREREIGGKVVKSVVFLGWCSQLRELQYLQNISRFNNLASAPTPPFPNRFLIESSIEIEPNHCRQRGEEEGGARSMAPPLGE